MRRSAVAFVSVLAAAAAPLGDAHAVRLVQGDVPGWGPAYLDLIGFLQPRVEFVDDDTRCPVGGEPCDAAARIRENEFGGAGFALRRARLGVQGRLHRFLALTTQVELAPQDGPALLDAYLDLPIVDALSFRFGQFKTPFSRQFLVPESRLQMIEYSLLIQGGLPDRDPSDLGVPGRDLGLMMTSVFGDGNLVELQAGFFGGDGIGRAHNPDDGTAFVVRLAANPFGAPGRLEESDVARETEPRLSVALDWATNRRGEVPDFEERTHHLGGDLAFFYSGLSFYGEALLRSFQSEDPQVADYVGFGFALQGGFFLPVDDLDRAIELTMRYDRYDPVRCLDLDCSAPQTGEPGLPIPLDASDPTLGRRTWTFGVNVFLTGDHTWKLQANYVNALETESEIATPPSGGLDDDAFIVQMTAHL